MSYSIGEVAKMMGLTTHTLRFYDKEGLLPNVRKNSAGLRRFTDDDVRWLSILECLKSTGLQLKDIKHYIDLAKLGDESLQERLEMFKQQRIKVENQICELQKNLEKIDFKIKYYCEAIKNGEKNVYKCNEMLAIERKRLFPIKNIK